MDSNPLSVAPKQALCSSVFHNLRGGLPNSYLQFGQNKQGRVAFLGGSITWNPGWREEIMAYLQQRFPAIRFHFVNAGIPSMGSTPSAFRLQRDIWPNEPLDLLFVEAAVNDQINGRSPKEQLRAMEGIVRNLRRNSALDIVMLHFADPDKIAAYQQGQEPLVIQNHNVVAEHYQIPTVNLAPKKLPKGLKIKNFAGKKILWICILRRLARKSMRVRSSRCSKRPMLRLPVPKRLPCLPGLTTFAMKMGD